MFRCRSGATPRAGEVRSGREAPPSRFMRSILTNGKGRRRIEPECGAAARHPSRDPGGPGRYSRQPPGAVRFRPHRRPAGRGVEGDRGRLRGERPIWNRRGRPPDRDPLALDDEEPVPALRLSLRRPLSEAEPLHERGDSQALGLGRGGSVRRRRLREHQGLQGIPGLAPRGVGGPGHRSQRGARRPRRGLELRVRGKSPTRPKRTHLVGRDAHPHGGHRLPRPRAWKRECESTSTASRGRPRTGSTSTGSR